MRRFSYVLLTAFLSTSLFACVVESGREYRRPAASTPYRNHGQERREEVHERNSERKAQKDRK